MQGRISPRSAEGAETMQVTQNSAYSASPALRGEVASAKFPQSPQGVGRNVDEYPVLHNLVDFSRIADVAGGVGIQNYQVGEFPARQRPQVALLAHNRGRIFRGGDEDFGWTH